MITKNEDWQRRIFQLWCDYLREIPNYKTFCKWWRNRKRYLKNKNFQNSSPRWLAQSLNFITFGDIYSPNYSFEKWWMGFRDHSKEIQKCHKPIVFGQELTEQLDAQIWFFKRLKHKDPGISEVKDLLIKDEPGSCLIKINIGGNSPKELRRQFNELILKKKRDPLVKAENCSLRASLLKPSSEYIRLDEIERYLGIYRSKNYKHMEISKILTMDEHYAERSRRGEVIDKREIYLDIQKAKRIIKNVERGFFPGDYGGVKEKN